MKVDCVVKGGRVVTPMGVIMGGVAISGGSIAAVGQDGLLPEGHRVIDAAGKFVIPGFIDMHSHLGAGGPIARIETDFISETEAAAHGGVTSFRSMVASMEPYLPQIDEIIGWGEKNSLVDFSFHAAIEVDEHFEELDALCDKGISGFKMFYTAYKGEEGRKLGQLGCDDGMVLRGCEFLARRGHPALITFHCEEQDIMDLLQPRVQGEGRGDLPAWTDARPDFIEPMSIDSAAWIAQATGARIHIAHVSTAEGAERIANWKGRGVQIFGETCPHYLVLTKHEEGLVPWGKINPPLRDAEDNARLWAALREGTIETMGTDNCPYTRA
ncbi:MAG: dihydroorotase family protein, partial [Nitrospinota bacterium]